MDYQTWIEVAVSGDARTWQVVRDRAPIYDLNRAGIGDKREASYPPSVSRYVRVRLLDGVTRFNVAGAAVAEETESKLELLPTDLVFAPSAVGDRRSGWVSQGGADGLTIAEIRIETTQAQFLRPLAVEASDDGTTWRRVASGEIARTRVQSETRETLSVPVWAPPAKYCACRRLRPERPAVDGRGASCVRPAAPGGVSGVTRPNLPAALRPLARGGAVVRPGRLTRRGRARRGGAGDARRD
jgi:hypothetical protein